MTAALRAALDEIDAETTEHRSRLTDLAEARRALLRLLDDTPQTGDVVTSNASPHVPPATTRPPSNRGGGRRHDLGEVARIAREALAVGQPLGPAIVAALGVSESMAGYLLTQARKAGHDIPRGNNGARVTARPPVNADDLPAPEHRPASTWAPKPGEHVVACRCGHVEPVTRVTALNRHCVDQHGRPATVEERTPRRWEAAT